MPDHPLLPQYPISPQTATYPAVLDTIPRYRPTACTRCGLLLREGDVCCCGVLAAVRTFPRWAVRALHAMLRQAGRKA